MYKSKTDNLLKLSAFCYIMQNDGQWDGPLFHLSAYPEDVLVERIELKNKEFVIGVKWYPELMLEEVLDNLFEKL